MWYNIRMDKVFLHCDLNNFYASVECKINPAYNDVPLAVCGDPSKRHGVILAKNYRARAFGIKTGDTVNEAYKKCPELVTVGPHFDLYMEYSDKAFDIYTKYTDRVEPFGSDECWLDVTGSQRLFGAGDKIADEIRNRVKTELGLTISAGVSFTKIFAKLGSDMKKPDAVTVISRENFRDKVWCLPAQDLMMVGRKTSEKLAKFNINTIGQLAAADDAVLKAQFGVLGQQLKNNALGLDPGCVRLYTEGRTVKSVGHGTTTVKDIDTPDAAYKVIYFLCDMVAGRLRKYGFCATGVHLDMRTTDLLHESRQVKLPRPTANGGTLSETAIRILNQNWRPGTKLRTLTVSAFDLVSAKGNGQLDFFDDGGEEKKSALDGALDKIRQKYGYNSLIRANLIDNDYIMDRFDNADFLPFQR